VDAASLAGLRDALESPVATDPQSLAAASHDASFVKGTADAVVRPRDTKEVVALVRWARSHRVPLTARGGGTSLDGESVPVSGGIVVDFSGWTTMGPVDAAGRTVQVGPGVVNRELHARLSGTGLFFPPNPGSWRSCTIGGNVGTNASGPRSFRYGPTRRWVHAAEVVLGTGEVAHLGPVTAKRSVGPELLDLIVGSEGTLALVTRVTLGLARSPARRCGVMVPVPDPTSVGSLAFAIASRVSLPTSAVEYVDATVAAALRTRADSRLPPGGALLLLELESEGAGAESEALSELDAVLRRSGVTEAASVAPDADRMWTVRGEAGEMLGRSTGASVREDVAVPVERVDRLLARLGEIAVAESVELHVYGHIGQGNLHPTFAVDPAGEKGRRVRSRTWEAARSLGGTVAGEHGVGSVKRDEVAVELGDAAVRVLRGWKELCDPDGILNPGKLLPPSDGPAP
jgi:D-lactate dehydrogenase